MSIDQKQAGRATRKNGSPQPRRDVEVLQLILDQPSELFINIVSEPCISLPLDSKADRTPWLLSHNRVRAEITGFAWDNAGLVLHFQELNRLLRVLESRAWKDQRDEIELTDAIDDDSLLEGLLILLADPDSREGVHLTATKLLQALNKKEESPVVWSGYRPPRLAQGCRSIESSPWETSSTSA